MKKFASNKNSVYFFYSALELRKEIPIKLYKIDGYHSIQNHTHDYIQIWYVCNGAFTHGFDNKQEYKVVKGNLFVVPPFAVHHVKIEKNEDLKIIGCEFLPEFVNDQFKNLNKHRDFFDFAYLEPFLVSQELVKPKINLVGEKQKKVQHLLEDMLKEYEEEKPYFEIVLKGDLLKLLSIIVREYNNAKQHNENEELYKKYREGIIDSINYIDGHLNEQIRLENICKYAMMSKTYFCYIFKKLTGKTFNEYLLDSRIEKAMELLTYKKKSVQYIANEVGFKDSSYFSKVFKKRVGVSPTAFVKNNKNNNDVHGF